MKRLLSLIMTVLVVCMLVLPGFAKDSMFSWLNRMPGYGDKRGLYWDWGVYSTYDDHQLFCVKISTPIYNIIAKCDEWIDLPAKDSDTVVTLLTISTSTLGSGTSTFAITDSRVVDPDLPRNICVSFDTMKFSTNTVYADITIIGLNARGKPLSEVVRATSTALTYSNNAFSKTNSFTIGQPTYPQNSTDYEAGKTMKGANLLFRAGTGDNIGLMGNVVLSTDCYKCTVDHVDETGDVTVNTTYDTWTHSDVPDTADDFRIYYKSASEIGDTF